MAGAKSFSGGGAGRGAAGWRAGSQPFLSAGKVAPASWGLRKPQSFPSSACRLPVACGVCIAWVGAGKPPAISSPGPYPSSQYLTPARGGGGRRQGSAGQLAPRPAPLPSGLALRSPLSRLRRFFTLKSGTSACPGGAGEGRAGAAPQAPPLFRRPGGNRGCKTPQASRKLLPRKSKHSRFVVVVFAVPSKI